MEISMVDLKIMRGNDGFRIPLGNLGSACDDDLELRYSCLRSAIESFSIAYSYVDRERQRGIRDKISDLEKRASYIYKEIDRRKKIKNREKFS